MTLSVVDLFSGAGGLTCGFRRAGCSLTDAVERDHWAAETFRLNHPGVNLVEKDIRGVDPKNLVAWKQRETDLFAVVGGAPCQGFSETNRRTRTVENQQNHLYREFFRFVRALRPRWFVFENVAGIRTLDRGRFLQLIMHAGRRAGYLTSYMELNAASYGVPQVRRRLFVVGSREHQPFAVPPPTHGERLSPFVTVRDAISDLPALKNGAAKDHLPYPGGLRILSSYQRQLRHPGPDATVQGNLVTNSNARVISRYRSVPQGRNWASIPLSKFQGYADVSRCHTGLYYRLPWREPARIIGNFRKNLLIHPSQNRGLSVREAARLQSFPDAFQFCGSIGFQQQQVADAVPPLLAELIASALVRASVTASVPARRVAA